jgi:hypothetical protein
MWMSYIREIEIKDLRSAIENLKQEFGNLKFDAEHEAVYGMGRFYTEEECNDLARKYRLGVEACEQYLEGTICINCLVQRIQAFELERFLYKIVDYLPDNLKGSVKYE